eukprot:9409-Heterococcus_DN1.PRE.4
MPRQEIHSNSNSACKSYSACITDDYYMQHTAAAGSLARHLAKHVYEMHAAAQCSNIKQSKHDH